MVGCDQTNAGWRAALRPIHSRIRPAGFLALCGFLSLFAVCRPISSAADPVPPGTSDVLVLFEDEPAIDAALDGGSGEHGLVTDDRHSGTSALRITAQRLAPSMPGWSFRIVEHPKQGQYRYLRFACKKQAGGGLMFELAHAGGWDLDPKSPRSRYTVGPNTTGWASISAGADSPSDWVVVTRDLWQDFGDWTLTGLTLTSIGGEAALYDMLLLGPSVESLDAYRPGKARTVSDAAPRLGDAWSDPQNPVVERFEGERLDLWSLKKPVRPPVPQFAEGQHAGNAIDHFILAAQQKLKPTPVAEADRPTLVRRLSFDLLGLPPTPLEAQQFVEDRQVGAYERLVDRLLASPHYGEQAGRLWLDVVRYSDTNGFERDEFRPTIWRYRDYVIKAFNTDRPYDEFVREQLAGDELAASHPDDARNGQRLTATGYLRLGLFDSTTPIFGEDAKGRDQLLADLVDNTGSAFLGLTMSCCRCHDHKYDPILQADHYRLRAFFAGIKPRDDLVVDSAEEQAKIKLHNEPLDAKIAALKQQLDALVDPEKLKKKRDEALAALSAEQRKQFDALTEQMAALEKERRRPATILAVNDTGPTAPATHLLEQGDFTQPGSEVPPGFLSVLDPNPARVVAVAESTGRRSALAAWLTSPDHPLTARVMVNRIWQQHFGRGLVATPNDFGQSGARPTHPELLDWLTCEFVESGWSIKHMHRLIVGSAAYRRSSLENPQGRQLDGDNTYYWRQNVRRLDAETLRDTLLAVSGQLLPVSSGRPRWPEVAKDILDAQPAIIEAANDRLQGYYTDPEAETLVRSVFVVHKRSVPLPFWQAFDLPDFVTSCARRNVTTVAPQALVLLNSPLAIRSAEAFAARLIKEAGPEPERQVDLAFSLALLRSPRSDERKVLLTLLAEHTATHAKVKQEEGQASPDQRALVDLARVLLNLNEFLYID